MAKGFRFYLAQWIGKLAIIGMKILGKRASYLPGSIALKIDPHYLAHVEQAKTLLMVTGTNGKTTVSNMLSDFLKYKNRSYINNGFGSNTREGISSLFLDTSTWGGKIREEFAIVELDERSAIRVFPDLQPNYMIVTNLFRDSYTRNAHADFIFSILDQSIPAKTHMILNAEDPISNRLVEGNSRVYYGIPLQAGEEEERNNRIKDLSNCPICHHSLEQAFVRYNHIGRYHCSNCEYKSPEPSYTVVSSDLQAQKAVFSNGDVEAEFNLATSNIVDMYNLLSVSAALQEMGFAQDEIADYSKQVEVVKSRFDDQIISGKRLLVIMAKGGNPVASSRTFDYLRKEEGKKAIVLQNGSEKGLNVENMGWIYDNEFSYLNDPSIEQIICCGRRYLDFALCLRMNGIPESKIVLSERYEDIADRIDYESVDAVCILRNFISDDLTAAVKASIQKKMEAL